jgi:hypothetical protein
MGKALGKLTVSREGALAGNEELINTFDRLGVSADELKNLSVDGIMQEIGRGSMNAADMVKVLGKSALELRPALEAAAEGGLGKFSTMSNEAVRTLGEAHDTVVAFAGATKDKLGEALAFVTDRWTAFSQAMGAASAAMSMAFQGASWEEAWGASQKALDSEGKKTPKDVKKRDFEEEELSLEKLKKLDEERLKIAQDQGKAREHLSETLQKISDQSQIDKLESLKAREGMSGMEIAETRRSASRDARETARAERSFARKFGQAELQRVKDLKDPAKQAEAAYEKALAPANQRLAEIARILDNRLAFPKLL